DPRLQEMPESGPSLGWLRPFVRPHRRPIAIAFLLSCIAAGLTLVLPILTQVVVDQVLPNEDLNLLYVIMLGSPACSWPWPQRRWSGPSCSAGSRSRSTSARSTSSPGSSSTSR